MNKSEGSLAAALQPFVDRAELAGAVALVADRDGVLAMETAGYADIAAGEPMRDDTLFWIASQTKPITATLLMMLVDEGKVALDDPVEKYLPEFQGQWLVAERAEERLVLTKPAHPITVREVLNHTSGLSFSSPLETPTLDLYPLEARVRSYAMTPLQTEPGSAYQYSNEGTNIAGRIVEVVSDMPYEEFLDGRLLQPLGMTDTTFWPDAGQMERLAKTYRPGLEGAGLEETRIIQLRYPLDDRVHRFSMPAGGLFSTAGDVARFCRMILNGGVLDGRRYLSEGAVREMTRRQTGDLPESYGLCWGVGDGGFGHGGAQATNMTIDPRSGLIFVFLVQHIGFPGEGGKSQAAFMEAARLQFAAR